MSAIAWASPGAAGWIRVTGVRPAAASGGRAGQGEREGGVLIELKVAAPAHLNLEVGEHADGALQGDAIGLLGAGHGLLREPGRRLQRLPHLALRNAPVEQGGRAMHLAQAADDGEDEAARALPVRIELLGECERGAQVA